MRAAIVFGGGALIASLVLGFLVSIGPPPGFDLAAAQLGGTALPLATFLTQAGLFPVYAALCVLLLFAGLLHRAWLRDASIAIVGLIVAWKVSDVLKALLQRPRPEHWYVMHETSASYPSGHAVLATAFYGFFAYLIWRSSLAREVRIAIVAGIALWVLAIGWSRLALGAHYPTDLLGGYLLGASALGFEIAAAKRLAKRPA